MDRDAVRYFFRGLPPAQSEAVQAHLAECRCCRGKLEVFERVWVRAGNDGRP